MATAPTEKIVLSGPIPRGIIDTAMNRLKTLEKLSRQLADQAARERELADELWKLRSSKRETLAQIQAVASGQSDAWNSTTTVVEFRRTTGADKVLAAVNGATATAMTTQEIAAKAGLPANITAAHLSRLWKTEMIKKLRKGVFAALDYEGTQTFLKG